jgi:hypothetical protein
MSRVIQHFFKNETTVGAVSGINDNLGADLCHMTAIGKGNVTASAILEGAIDPEAPVWQELCSISAPVNNTVVRDSAGAAKRFDSLGFPYIRACITSASGNITGINVMVNKNRTLS